MSKRYIKLYVGSISRVEPMMCGRLSDMDYLSLASPSTGSSSQTTPTQCCCALRLAHLLTCMLFDDIHLSQ